MSDWIPDDELEPDRDAFTGISVFCREILVAMLQDGDRDLRFPVLKIGMPCGNEYIFECREDMPEKTLVCKCGDPKHIVIEYLKEDENDTST